MPIFNNILAGASGATGGDAFAIERSLRFNSGDSAHLSRTVSSAGNRKTWTWSGWVKRSSVSGSGTYAELFGSFFGNSTRYTSLKFNANDKLFFFGGAGDPASNVINLETTQVFRDFSGWYHIVLAFDTTQSTASDRVKLYVNGTQVTDFDTETYPAQNVEYYINQVSVEHVIGSFFGTLDYLNGYLAEVNFIDGQALAPTDFGETDDNGVWQAKEFTGTYGWFNNSRAWSDSSVTTFTNAFSLSSYPPSLLFNGNTTDGVPSAESGDFVISFSTAVTVASSVLILASGGSISSVTFDSNSASNTSGDKWEASFSGTFSTITIVGSNNRYVKAIYIDGKLLIDSSVSVADNSFRLPFTDNSSTEALGYDAAVTDPTLNPKGGMDVVTYSGNGGTQSIGGLGFQPDFVWIKSRNAAGNHALYDSVRGATKRIQANETAAENTKTNGLTSFNSDGWTEGNFDNQSGYNYVAWCWKAGGAAVSNTNGSINSSVSVNSAYGFSVTKYVGTGSLATVGHGLGNSAPKFMLIKGLDDSLSWAVYADSPSNYLQLSDLGASNSTDASNAWNGTAPTSSVFTVKTKATVNESGENYIAYVWSEIAGFSKFGSYSGSSSPVTLNLGFKPAFLMIKRADGIDDWAIFDNERPNKYLNADTSEADKDASVSRIVAFTSTGAVVTGTNGQINANGMEYIYAAFAASIPGDPDNDSLVDSPSNAADPTDTGVGNEVVGNYATLNPLQKGSLITLSNGNLEFSAATGSGSQRAWGTVGVSTGKWYFEYTQASGTYTQAIGIKFSFDQNNSDNYLYNGNNGQKINASGSASSYGATWANNDVVGVAFDLDAGAITFYKNGVSQGVAFTGITASTYFPFVLGWSGGAFAGNLNFGQRAFAYPPNTGPVYSDNASTSGSTSTGTKANAFNGSITDYWQTSANASQTYTFSLVQTGTLEVYQSGTGTEYNIAINGGSASSMTRGASNGWETIASNASTLTSVTFTRPRGSNNQVATWAFRVNGTDILIDGLGAIKTLNTASLTPPTIADGSKYFDSELWTGNGTSQTITTDFLPGLIWVKERSNTSSHQISNIISGVGKRLSSNLEDAEYSNSQMVTAFNSDGFGIGSQGGHNENNQTYVGWVWGAGTGSTGTNNDGSIASQVRANPSAGFSIVKYTANGSNGATIGHGLNAQPYFMIGRQYTAASGWGVYHNSIGNTGALHLNNTTSVSTSSIWWNNTSPSNSVFTIGTVGAFNTSGEDVIFFCFAPVEGYSAMGSYVGNGSSDGPFIHTGFKVAWLLTKRTNGGSNNWQLIDSTRSPFNVADDVLKPDESAAESSHADYSVDFLSNGFKHRTGHVARNGSGNTYIYAAFAENPFQANGGLAR